MVTLEQIREADRLRGVGRFRETPLHYPSSLNARLPTHAKVHLKLEMLQRTGSFKVRGAVSRIFAMTEQERARGIIAASAGNHAQGVALAAGSLGVRARIVMPEYAPITKQEATAGYGAEIVLHGATYDDAAAYARELHEEEGGTLVHAFDDDRVMAGQGTIALEVLRQLPDVRSIIVPVGGGGLISGIAVAVKSLRPEVRVIGVQAAGADSAVRSFHAGRRLPCEQSATIADGINVQLVGERTYDVIQKCVDDMVTVSEVDLCRAVLYMDEHAHVCAEPAGAAPIAALLAAEVGLPLGPAVAIVSGGNIDTFAKSRYVRRALAEDRRHLRIAVRLPDVRGARPRQMAGLFELLGQHEVNVLHITDRRDVPGLPIGIVEVELFLETRGPRNADAVERALYDAGFQIAKRPGSAPVRALRGRPSGGRAASAPR